MLSAVAVEPTTSVKTAVISLRSSLGASASTSGEPQARQNFAIGGFSWPQLAQTAINRVYVRLRRRQGKARQSRCCQEANRGVRARLRQARRSGPARAAPLAP